MEVEQQKNIQSNSTYSKANFSKDDIIKDNGNSCQKFDLKLPDEDHSLPIMYQLPKLHYTPTGARFITASKNCGTRPLSGVISKTFKMIFKHVANFHNKSTFYLSYKKFWALENFFPIIEKLKVFNTKG